ncbi:hypothetical protein ACFSJY_14495 [Thalassotalea euphylliae]|uniref:hypothetical protein n=1 Tax=Thalassotalea euphylliae TaxID=1655234 RepID=UPI0036391D5E
MVTRTHNNPAESNPSLFLTVKNSIKQYKARWLIASLVILATLMVSNPQGFINLWLTRDQQAMLMVERQEFGKAALTFSDQHWIAYSYYANGEFLQAATIFAQLTGEEALFGEANALAHAGNINLAIKRYEELLAEGPQENTNNALREQAQANLAILTELAKKQVKTKAKDGCGPPPDDAIQMSEEELAQIKKNSPKNQANLSGEMWLQQVQQNPSKFLKKKFKQEYTDANR